MTRTVLLAAVVAAGLALSACEKQIEAPMDRGLCTQLVFKNGKAQFNTVSKNEPTLEACAASLEGMRLRFLRLGGSMETISGAYQGQFLFLQPEGVHLAELHRRAVPAPSAHGRWAAGQAGRRADGEHRAVRRRTKREHFH